MSLKTCLIDGCDRNAYSRGWCRVHYTRWRRHGDPETILRFNSAEESFSFRTKWQGNCLIWTGAKGEGGYGRIVVNGKVEQVHRYAWERVNGPIPESMLLDHINHCDPACCNPDHLRIASMPQNGANRSGTQKNNRSSGIRNVYWDSRRDKWIVQAMKNRKQYYFGQYKDIQDAEKAAIEAREELFGEYAGRS